MIFYTAHCMAFGASYAVLALGVSPLTGNALMSIGIPAVLYHASVLAAGLLPKSLVYEAAQYIPYETFSIPSKPISAVIYGHLSVLLLGAILYGMGIYRYRRKAVQP